MVHVVVLIAMKQFFDKKGWEQLSYNIGLVGCLGFKAYQPL